MSDEFFFFVVFDRTAAEIKESCVVGARFSPEKQRLPWVHVVQCRRIRVRE